MGKSLKGNELGKGLSQRKDSRYCARYIDRSGKRVSIYSHNLRELKTQLKEAVAKNKIKLDFVNGKVTLDEWFIHWLNVIKYKTIRDTTKCNYENVYNRYISEVLGKYPIDEIKQLQVKEFINSLDKIGLGSGTQYQVKIILSDIFNKAMICGFVKKNPVKDIKIITDVEKLTRVLTLEEQGVFFSYSNETFYDNLFTVAVMSGLRPGELFALTCSDVDFVKMEISITKTLLYLKLNGEKECLYHIHKPKTKSSVRTVPINKQCEMALRKQLNQRNIIMDKNKNKLLDGFQDILFTTKFGTPINSKIMSDAIRVIVDKINLYRCKSEKFEIFTGICFRHTFATRCFESGIRPKTIQAYLGHEYLNMTMDLYVSVLELCKKDEMFKLENFYDAIFD